MELDSPTRGSAFLCKEGVLVEFFVKALGITTFNGEAYFTNDESAISLDVTEALERYGCSIRKGQGQGGGEVGKY